MNTEAEALYQSARAACRDGRFQDGIALAEKALGLDPGAAPVHKLIGMALGRLGRHDEALATFDRALALAPDAADIHGSRADTLAALGRLDEAVASYDRALALDPSAIADWINRGVALLKLERFDEALANYDRLISLAPQEADAHCGRGNALTQLARVDEACVSYDCALALDPRHAEALSNRANALDRLGRPQDALRDLDAALGIEPDHRGALTTRAIVLRKLGRPAEALASCQRTLALDPNDIDALTVRGDVLTDMERLEDAIATFDRVIAQKPNDVGAKWNKSLLSLTLGRFADGWPLYENRWAGAKGLVPRDYQQPRWNGGRVAGALLIWSEQGLGDEILHSSMIPDAKARTDDIVLEAERRLVPLFARSFPDVKVIALAPSLYTGRIDQQEPLGSLGRHFRPSWEAFPRCERGHLIANAARAAALRARLDDGRKVIGLSWVSKAPIGGASKSARLTDFAALLRLPGYRFVDLQYGDTGAERVALKRDHGFEVEHLPNIDNMNDIDGLAALMAACDAVVTVSNTTAHLAGALGRPTWVMVPHGHARIWYWFRDRRESPWYPRARVRRQARGQPWADLVAGVAQEVDAVAATELPT